MRLVLLGPPGAGKGTQAAIISKRLSIPTISTGSILREAISKQTELGKLAQVYIKKGELVPDEVVIGIVKTRISEADCRGGYILDGFPRTLKQAEELDNIVPGAIDKAIMIDSKEDIIIKRLSGRRECKGCGAIYHTANNPPKLEGVCDKCGGELYIRPDDKPETIKRRISVYNDQTKPIIDYYKGKGKLLYTDGDRDLSDITKSIFEALKVLE